VTQKTTVPRKSRTGRGRYWPLAALAAAAVLIVTTHAVADVEQLAARLAGLRGEVEDLARQLSSKSAESQDQLRALSRQRSELQLEQKREQTRAQKLSAAIAEQRTEIQAEKAKTDRVVPLYKDALRKVREYVKSTMPFRTKERLVALDKIDEQYKAGLITAPRALSRVWSFIEDEFRMTRENGLFKQTVVVDGRESLADVVRLGMVMMFYRTEDDEVGRALFKDGKWTYEPISGPEEQRAVHTLFTSFKKQIRVGYFELPNALPPIVSEP
jgi:hypothetical protein